MTEKQTETEVSEETAPAETDTIVTGKPAEPELLVYVDGYSNTTEITVNSFAAAHPDIKVNIERFTDMPIAEFNQKVEADMRAGAGPDVVLVNNSSAGTFKNITQMVKDGLILDVNSINADLSDCNETVMKAGQFEGAQYLVPVTYSLGLMYTTEERLAAYGIEYEEGMTLAEFAAQLPEFYENNPNTKIFPTYLTSYFLCTQNAMDLIDHENGTIKNDAESLAALEAMSEAFDGLFPNIYGDAAQYMTYRDHKGKTDAQMYREEALLFASARSFTGNYECINIITNALYMEDVMQGETPLLIHLPTIDGGAPAPVMTYYLMANANTENKYAVREFIEYAVGDENQIMLSGCGIPVNYDAQAFYEEWFGNENSKIGEKYGLWKAGTPDEEFVEAYFELIDNMRDPIWNDYAVLDGMTAVIRAYSWDRLPMDEALASQTEELEALIAK